MSYVCVPRLLLRMHLSYVSTLEHCLHVEDIATTCLMIARAGYELQTITSLGRPMCRLRICRVSSVVLPCSGARAGRPHSYITLFLTMVDRSGYESQAITSVCRPMCRLMNVTHMYVFLPRDDAWAMNRKQKPRGVVPREV